MFIYKSEIPYCATSKQHKGYVLKAWLHILNIHGNPMMRIMVILNQYPCDMLCYISSCTTEEKWHTVWVNHILLVNHFTKLLLKEACLVAFSFVQSSQMQAEQRNTLKSKIHVFLNIIFVFMKYNIEVKQPKIRQCPNESPFSLCIAWVVTQSLITWCCFVPQGPWLI